jgi:hypothetical protein
MNAELKAKWIAALRSGDYKQGRSRLATVDGGYCCLGVLCEVLELPKKRVEGGYEFAGLSCVLSYSITEPLGIDSIGSFEPDEGDERAMGVRTGEVCQAASLAMLNDSGYSFAEIADMIEKYF